MHGEKAEKKKKTLTVRKKTLEEKKGPTKPGGELRPGERMRTKGAQRPTTARMVADGVTSPNRKRGEGIPPNTNGLGAHGGKTHRRTCKSKVKA